MVSLPWNNDYMVRLKIMVLKLTDVVEGWFANLFGDLGEGNQRVKVGQKVKVKSALL